MTWHGHSATCSRGWDLLMVLLPLHQGHLRSGSHGQPWWEAAEASRQEGGCPQGAEVAAAQLLPPAEGQQTLQPTATSSAGVTLLCVTPVTGHCHTATSPHCPQQREHFSCAKARGYLLPSTGRRSPCQCHLITTQGQPLPPLGTTHRPQAKYVCKFVPANPQRVCV